MTGHSPASDALLFIRKVSGTAFEEQERKQTASEHDPRMENVKKEEKASVTFPVVFQFHLAPTSQGVGSFFFTLIWVALVTSAPGAPIFLSQIVKPNCEIGE